MAHLRREIDFRGRLWPEFAGAVVKSSLTIGLAVGGLGIWSLAIGQLAAVAVTAVLYWCVSRASPIFGFDAAVARSLVGFGIPVTGVSLLAFAIYNVDYLAIGTRLGDTALGLYTLAYRVPELAVLAMCSVISEVLFSVLSRLQHEREALGQTYLRSLNAVVALTAPVGIGLAVCAPTVVTVMYGGKYDEAGPILAVLAIYAVVYSASFHSGDVYKAIGRPGILTSINAGKLAVLVAPIWLAAGRGPIWVAAVLLAVECLHFAVRMTVVRNIARLSYRQIAPQIARPFSAAAMMGASVILLRLAIDNKLPPIFLLLCCVVVGLSSYVLFLRFTSPVLYEFVLVAVRSRLPHVLATRVNSREIAPTTYAPPAGFAPRDAAPTIPMNLGKPTLGRARRLPPSDLPTVRMRVPDAPSTGPVARHSPRVLRADRTFTAATRSVEGSLSRSAQPWEGPTTYEPGPVAQGECRGTPAAVRNGVGAEYEVGQRGMDRSASRWSSANKQPKTADRGES